MPTTVVDSAPSAPSAPCHRDPSCLPFRPFRRRNRPSRSASPAVLCAAPILSPRKIPRKRPLPQDNASDDAHGRRRLTEAGGPFRARRAGTAVSRPG